MQYLQVAMHGARVAPHHLRTAVRTNGTLHPLLHPLCVASDTGVHLGITGMAARNPRAG
eukprot:SAG31_NODE_14786_length_787_cov_2.029070_1_plen_58_part_10